MAIKDKERELDREKQNYTFEENPLEYCKAIYTEAKERNDLLRPINIENEEFYQGRDKILEERRDDPRVKRSSLFVHELTPAVDSRIGDAVSRLEEREHPITAISVDEKSEPSTQDDVQYMIARLNEQMRECGYLSDIFEEHVRAGEIYRTPSVVKVYWKRETKMVPVVENRTPLEQAKAFFSFRDASLKVKWEKKDYGKPYAEWIPPEQFLYEPGVSKFEDSTYCIHAMWRTYEEIMALAEEFDYDKDKIEEFSEEMADESSATDKRDSVAEATHADNQTPFREGVNEGKWLLTENYISTFDDMGNEVIRLVVVLGNKYILKKEKSPYKGIRFPFVPLVVKRLPGSIENLSSIDIGKYMQRLYNEGINSYLDGESYRIFPPFKAKQNSTSFREAPVYGPGEIWWLSDPESLEPVIQNPGTASNLPSVMEGISAKIRNSMAVPDFMEGTSGASYEKATKTRLRAAGSARRSVPINRKYGMAVIGVANMFVALNQQYADDGYRWVHNVRLDVPSLTGIGDPEQDKQDLLLLIAQMRQDPMFQTPLGKKKVRNVWEDFIRLVKKTDAYRYVQTEAEYEQEQQLLSQMENAMLDKQNTQEKMAIAQAMAPSGEVTNVQQ